MRIWAVLIGLIVTVSGVLMLAWLLWRLWRGDETEAPEVIEIEVPEPEPVRAALEVEVQEEEETPAPTDHKAPLAPEMADDLKVIEGIGPKISQVLREGGIATFAQLAGTDAETIRVTLEAADPRLGRLADPSTWPAQAALAAEGKWEALADLQGELKGGRRA